ncbi:MULTISPECIES: DUF3883 domain-containing protein [unclassified Streptomyces]|uniref:DUF3883 domain-containing protein n=1 Tax=unclassified Streptomyces TaxID=2593676 RepID=UPI00136B4B16|nr:MULTISPECIES: DUF3883 domain-containing protein [unclassified Streptomyces]MYT71535.1 DUF3883 domain-containing protein [Streptomyces sp. SID8367]
MTLFTHHSDYADLTAAQYLASLNWLRSTGLVDVRDRPAWLNAEAGLRTFLMAAESASPGCSSQPDMIREAGDAFGAPASVLQAVTGEVRGKADLEERARIGAAGERALVQALRQAGWGVRHVSEESDAFGYDIAVTGAFGRQLHLEVKSTLLSGARTAYLTRHEYRTMLGDDAWQMIAVRLGKRDQLLSIVTVDRGWIESVVPSDRSRDAAWHSTRLDIPDGQTTAGIQGLEELGRSQHRSVDQGVIPSSRDATGEPARA